MNKAKNLSQKKICKFCGNGFKRKRCGKRLEDYTRFLKREYCNQSCANSKKNPRNRTTFYLRARKYIKNVCEGCKIGTGLDVHHIDGNIKKNNPENIMTLCHSCHMKLHWRQNPYLNSSKSKQAQRIGFTDLKPSGTQSSPKSLMRF